MAMSKTDALGTDSTLWKKNGFQRRLVISCSTFYIILITGTGNELGRIAGWKTLLEGGMIIAERNVVVGKPTCRTERVNQI